MGNGVVRDGAALSASLAEAFADLEKRSECTRIVTLCKYCIKANPPDGECVYCTLWKQWMEPDNDYCSMGIEKCE
jgi:hypothetical protein